MARIPRIALLIETSREYGRGLLRGVAHYQREHGPWSVFFEPHGLDDPAPKWLRDWDGDGILARVNSREMAECVKQPGLPVVDLRGAVSDTGIPFIGVDNAPVAKLAFQHLWDCGLRRFAFCGTPRGENPNQDRRRDYFVSAVEHSGHSCSLWLGEAHAQRRGTWEQEQQAIVEWLRGLPLPVGIMTCHDDRGQRVLDACRRAGLDVPNEVAVIGVDNDPYICNLCSPPMTSIDVNPGLVGFEAAKLLAKLMAGKPTDGLQTLLGPPRGISARSSTDVLAVGDEGVAEALRYIRDNATRGIQVSDVVANARRSPSTLERRVKRAVGRTIKAEITRVKLARARLLLAETDYPVQVIAHRCGFSQAKYFCDVFRRHEAITPTEYRRRFRVMEPGG